VLVQPPTAAGATAVGVAQLLAVQVGADHVPSVPQVSVAADAVHPGLQRKAHSVPTA
jgi:hypothetical protein